MKKQKNQFYKGSGNCPYCAKRIEIIVRKITKTKPQKGEYEFRQVIEKDSQTELPMPIPKEKSKNQVLL